MWYSAPARRFADNVVNAADPGRDYREKQRQVATVGSVDAKRALAEECIRGHFADAVELYESAMQGPLGAGDPALLKGLGRARMLSGDGAAAEGLFQRLKETDPAAFDADAELDYARALALQGKNDAAVRQYESVVPRYPGEEARCRFALLLEQLGQEQRAQALFREILESVKGAPSYYRRVKQNGRASLASTSSNDCERETRAFIRRPLPLRIPAAQPAIGFRRRPACARLRRVSWRRRCPWPDPW